MEIKETISVWLMLDDGDNKGKFVLQQRSLKNATFPYVCQATWAGKMEIGEDPNSTIKRECEEELGSDFSKNFDFSKLKLFQNNNFAMNGKEWLCHNYVGTVSSESMKTVKIHDEAMPEVIFIGRHDIFFSLESNKDPKDSVVLFNDQYKILKDILK